MYNLEIDISILQVKKELGYTEQTSSNPKIDDLIANLINKAYSLINPRGNYIIIDKFQLIDDQINLKEGALTFSSHDVAKLLVKQKKVVLLAATIGAQLEEQVTNWFDEDELTKATILDAIGSAAAEEVANTLTTIINQQAQKKGLPCLTMRFSPGYGDLSLAVQPELLELVGGQKLGITANSSHLLSPQKSITALLGLGTEPGPKPGCDFNCQSCSYKECIYS